MKKSTNRQKKKAKAQAGVADPPQREEGFSKLLDLDHMSKLKVEDFKVFEEIKE